RALFQRSPLARMIVTVDAQGRCIYSDVNEAAAAYFEIPREQMIGRTAREMFDRALAEQFEQSCLSCLKTLKPVMHNALPRFPGGVRVQAFVLTPILDADHAVRFIEIVAKPDAADSM